MSLPNGGDDDDQWRGQQPYPFGKGDPRDFQKDHSSQIILSPSSEDNATAAETSVESNSVMSGLSSVAPGDGAALTNTPTAAPPQTPTPVVYPNIITDAQRTEQNNATLQLIHHGTNTSMRTIRSQRNMYLRQLRTLAMASGGSIAVAILILVPPPVLISMMLCLMVLATFFYKLYQLLLWEYQRLVRGRGIGDYLPSSIYEQLTQTSVHDFMSDTRNSYVNENAYLMLYMIPGLTHDQINEYVGRLSPRHQELLHRQGLGYVLGNGFMRFIMGDERLQRRPIDASSDEDDDMAAISGVTESPSNSLASGGSAGGGGAGHHNIVPRRLELPPTIPEGTSEDDDSITSELGHEEDPATQYLRHWGVEPENSDIPPTTVRRRTAPSNSASAPVSSSHAATSSTADAPVSRRDSRQQQTPTEAAAQAEAEAEEQVIYDAIGSAVATYMGVAASMVQTSARRSATLFSGTLFRASMGMTLFGVGVGIYGFWTGVYNPRTFFQPALQMLRSQVGTLMRPPRRLEMPQSQVLLGTTMFSGATAGIMLLFQLASVREDEKQQPNNQGCEDHDTKKTKGTGPSKKPI
ncbi:hypothetical protein IV203_012404 [Nitzschia inconspicua]|uniref:Transmembrane protein n=1 Tax=Nitzschia inconspicua TaxID=303405 RepID=A0A9K3KUH5_9STRA|nr:hypothetical protein IV203_012404 [Nitzschia inconspicua]